MGEDETGLPAIGRPATGALAAIGVTRLDQVPEHRAEDLLALHGVGPKAIGILRTALVERGLGFAERPRGHVSDEVQAYVDALDSAHRRLFDRLHALILGALPDAEIVLSYGIPLYRVGRRHVGLNAGRADGVTLTTTSPDHIAEFRRRHPRFRTNTASIQFPLDDELPEDAIVAVVHRAIRP